MLCAPEGPSWTRPPQDLVRGRKKRPHVHIFRRAHPCFIRTNRIVWQKDYVLRKKFSSTEAVLAEMRTIRCIEHTGRMKVITPFVGSQVDICKAFGFAIPDGCAPVSSPRLSQQPTKEVTRLSQKWKNRSFRYTKLKNSD